MIGEQKQLFEQSKLEYHKRLETAESSHRDSLRRHQTTIVDLQNELVTLRHQQQQAAKGSSPLHSGFPRLLESLGKPWILFLENSRTWKVLENHFGPGNPGN